MSQKWVCVVLGGGGHGKVVIDSILSSQSATLLAVLDRDTTRWGQKLLGVPILGEDTLLPDLITQGANCFVVGLGSVGDCRPRQRLFELGLAHHLVPLTVKHPSAICSPWAEVSQGVQLLPGSIVNAGARLGQQVLVNSAAVVEHDCWLEDHVHVATGAKLASTVRVGMGSHIGAGATVLQGVTIGEGAVVGAGAVVLRDVPDWTVVVGIPARPL